MEIRMFDLLVLFTLAILVATIICYHVVDTINNKLSDIAINMPTPICPQPRIIIRSQQGDNLITPMQYSLDMTDPRTTRPNRSDTPTPVPKESPRIQEGFAESVTYPDADYIVNLSKKCISDNRNIDHRQLIGIPGSGCTAPIHEKKTIHTQMIGADGNFVENNMTMYVPQTFMGRDEFISGAISFNSFDSDQANPIGHTDLLGHPSKILHTYNEYQYE